MKARLFCRRSEPLAQVAELWDFKTPRAFEGKNFLSVRNKFEYDCFAARRGSIGRVRALIARIRRMLSTTGFSGQMGQGGVVASDQAGAGWVEIATTGPSCDAWKAACARPFSVPWLR